MNFKSFKCKLITLPIDDIYADLKGINKLRAKYELLCHTLTAWQLNLEQNSAQLGILDETAENLNERHKLLTDMLALRPNDPAILCRLQREIKAIEIQLAIWIREIEDISLCRKQMNLDYSFDFYHQNIGLKRSLTNIELASMDADRLDAKHRLDWQHFLRNSHHQKQRQLTQNQNAVEGK